MEITIGNNTVQIDSWNTLSWKQLYTFCKLSNSTDNPASLKVKLLLNFCGLKLLRKRPVLSKNAEYQWFKSRGRKILISIPVINTISKHILTSFYKETEEGNYVIFPRLSINIIPPIRIGLRCIYGPGDGLSNITFKEFIHTETYYQKYLEDGSSEMLDKIIAVLFRRRVSYFKRKFSEYSGDNRRKFNDYIIDKHAKRISRINKHTKTAILYYYQGCRALLNHLFPEVFISSGSAGADTDTFRMYMGLVDFMSGSNPTQKEALRNQPLYEVLDTLNNLAINAKSAKK